MNGGQAVEGLLWFVAFLFSTTVHEAAHAFAAWRGGDPTAYQGGQVSLNPLPHIRREPVGMVVVPLLTAVTQGWAIGWASTPYDPMWEARHPRRAALMAAAGPASNFAIAAVTFALLRIGLVAGWFAAPVRAGFTQLVVASGGGLELRFAAEMLSILLTLNVLLMMFNLLPFPPLDGATAFGILLPEGLRRTVLGFARSPLASLAGLLIAWRVFPMVVRPLLAVVLNLLHPGMTYG